MRGSPTEPPRKRNSAAPGVDFAPGFGRHSGGRCSYLSDTPMDPVLSEWISTMLRWLHVIAAMAWIGTSFYFVHLDLSLRPRDGLPPGVRGDAWQAHGGGFYHMMKYVTVPPQLPPEVTW